MKKKPFNIGQLENLSKNSLTDSHSFADEAAQLLIRVERRAEGRTVTCIFHIPGDSHSLLKKLKRTLATGGTQKPRWIELNGNHIESLSSLLVQWGFRVRLGEESNG